jgi:hypothetical protein
MNIQISKNRYLKKCLLFSKINNYLLRKPFKFQQKRKVKFVLTSARRLDAGARALISAWSVKTLYIKEHAYPAARVLRGEFTHNHFISNPRLKSIISL